MSLENMGNVLPSLYDKFLFKSNGGGQLSRLDPHHNACDDDDHSPPPASDAVPEPEAPPPVVPVVITPTVHPNDVGFPNWQKKEIED